MISVLLPVYNGEKYIRQSIQSILNQTFKNFEFLIIDDGSTDNTAKIVKSIDDVRINYIKKKHTGLADTLNYGLKIAKYDWIARMDADDISHPERLSIQINFALNNPQYDIISSWYAVFNQRIKYLIKVPQYHNQIVKKMALFSSICHPSVMYNRSKILQLLDHVYYDYKVAQDYDLWLRVKKEVRFYNIPKVLLCYRFLNKSNSRKNHYGSKKDYYRIQKKYYDDLKNEFGIEDIIEQTYYRALREYFFGDRKKARFYIKKLRSNVIKFPKAIAVFLFSFFNEQVNKKIIDNKLWLRFSYLKMKFNRKYRNQIRSCENLIKQYK